jgi:hypothetical protein
MRLQLSSPLLKPGEPTPVTGATHQRDAPQREARGDYAFSTAPAGTTPVSR